MDHYTAERLLIESQRRMVEAVERRARLMPAGEGGGPTRVWVAQRLREVADRIEGRAQLQRV